MNPLTNSPLNSWLGLSTPLKCEMYLPTLHSTVGWGSPLPSHAKCTREPGLVETSEGRITTVGFAAVNGTVSFYRLWYYIGRLIHNFIKDNNLVCDNAHIIKPSCKIALGFIIYNIKHRRVYVHIIISVFRAPPSFAARIHRDTAYDISFIVGW